MNKNPLVLLPGTLCDERLWESTIRYLPPTTEIICPQYTCGETMSEVISNIRAELPEKFALVGFSLGGLAALELIKQAPDSVTGLAIISSHAGADTCENKQTRTQQLKQAQEQGIEPLVTSTLIKSGLISTNPLVEENSSLIMSMAKSTDLNTFERQTLMAITREDHHKTLKEFSRSILILASLNDNICSSSKTLLAAKANDNAELIWINDASHYLPLEQPQQIAKQLDNWLKHLS